MATRFYIDGLNLYYGAVKGTSDKWLDLEALARILVPHDDLDHIHYFTANVSERYEGDQSGKRQQVFLRAVRANPLITVTLGHFRSDVRWRALADGRYGPDELHSPPFRPRRLHRWMWNRAVKRRTEPFSAARVLIREEKGSDVNLAVQLVWDAVHRNCSKAVVISNDADLEHAIRRACEAGIEVGVVNPHHTATNRRLKKAATFEIPFRHEVLARCQMPQTVTDPRGRTISRPKAWASC